MLAVQPVRELDLRLSLFTKKFGKIKARARSARKITSKLAGHLQVGDLVQVRIVEKQGLQVVDALKKIRLPLSPHDLGLLDGLLPEFQPEAELWRLLGGEELPWRRVLKVLGWDPDHAHCRICQDAAVIFDPRSQDFFCARCASKLVPDAVSYINI